MPKRTKLVRLSRTLEDGFDELPNKSDWDPTGFPEFVREAVRYYLQRQEERVGMVFSVDRQEDGSDREESP